MNLSRREYEYVKSHARTWYDCDVPEWKSHEEREAFAIYAGETAKERDSMDVDLPILFRIFIGSYYGPLDSHPAWMAVDDLPPHAIHEL